MLCKWLADLPRIQEERDDNPLRLFLFLTLSPFVYTKLCPQRKDKRVLVRGCCVRCHIHTHTHKNRAHGSTHIQGMIMLVWLKNKELWKGDLAGGCTTHETNLPTNLYAQISKQITANKWLFFDPTGLPTETSVALHLNSISSGENESKLRDTVISLCLTGLLKGWRGQSQFPVWITMLLITGRSHCVASEPAGLTSKCQNAWTLVP